MAEIKAGELIFNETNKDSKGGTELMAIGLHKRLDKKDLEDFQIVFSRVRGDLEDDKIRLFYCHDLPGDPESEFLKDEFERSKFHAYLFVSNWQMQAYINYYRLPWNKCFVMKNAIDPIPDHKKPSDKINLVYFSTPHRGLEILVPVFEKLAEETKEKVHLYVYSSFNLYGWGQKDEPYKKLFERIDKHKDMTYHGSVSNDDIRNELQKMHILAYPSIWHETSCLTLMESMSAGLTCVHPNFGALYETAANWTQMYQWTENPNAHAARFYSVLKSVIEIYDDPVLSDGREMEKNYANYFYSWEKRIPEWISLLENFRHAVKDRSLPVKEKQFFQYST